MVLYVIPAKAGIQKVKNWISRQVRNDRSKRKEKKSPLTPLFQRGGILSYFPLIRGTKGVKESYNV
jgi:hypothetical protein